MEVTTRVDEIKGDLQALMFGKPSIVSVAEDIGKYLDNLEEVPQEVITWLKNAVQKEAVSVWHTNNQWAAIIAATGVGKSKIAIDICKAVDDEIRLSENRSARILLFVPTEKLRDENWRDEFVKWEHVDLYEESVHRECYASATKLENNKFDLVIMDEYHNITENNSEFFSKNKVDRLLPLSATPPRDAVKQEILKNLNIQPVYSVDLDSAVQLRLVSPYEIVVVETRLDNADKYIQAGNAKNRFFQTEVQRYTYLTNDYQRKMYSGRGDAAKWAALARMRFIYNLKSKTEAAKHVLSLIPRGERVVSFCGSIEQATQLAEDHATFHSKSSSEYLKEFQDGEIERLTCVNALNEGMNLSNVDYGVLVQVNGNEKNLTQRIGRIIRYREGHVGKIILLVTTDTQDEVWVKKIISGLDQSKIRYVRYQNLINGTDTL